MIWWWFVSLNHYSFGVLGWLRFRRSLSARLLLGFEFCQVFRYDVLQMAQHGLKLADSHQHLQSSWGVAAQDGLQGGDRLHGIGNPWSVRPRLGSAAGDCNKFF